LKQLNFFEISETVSVIVFTIEYAVRIWIAPENPVYANPYGRLKYALTWMAIIDFVSIFPFYLKLFAPIPSTNTAALRIVRVFRILKTEQYSHAFDSVARVIRKKFGNIVCWFSSLDRLVIDYIILALLCRSRPGSCEIWKRSALYVSCYTHVGWSRYS